MSTDAPAENVIRERYHLRELLGHGGMGMVWSAHDQRLDRTVALKLLRPDVPESTATQMEREARAAARIDDRRIVTVLDLDHMEDGRPFLVLELHDGWTLADELKDGPLPPDRFSQLADDLLGGLASAHDCGVMHRDIKPANVLAETGGFRITDFGLASIDTDQSTECSLMGTLAYIAPERLHGSPGTFTADVFSASVVLYEAASGRKPFQAGTPSEAIMAVRSRQVAPLPGHVPPPLASAILRGLDPDPARRPARAGELLVAAHEAGTTLDDPVDVTQPLEQTRPLAPVDEHPADDTLEALRPRSGSTRVFSSDSTRPDAADATTRSGTPRPPTGAPDARRPGGTAAEVFTRRPDLLVAAAVVLAFAFVLGAIAAGGEDAEPAPAGETRTSDTSPTPEQQLQDNLAEIEDLGR